MLRFSLLAAAIAIIGLLYYVARGEMSETSHSDIKADETLVFFRTAAWLDENTNTWHVPIHGWIYEPQDSVVRKATFAEALKRKFDLTVDESSEANFSRRLNLLIADNERGKQIVIEIAGRTHKLPPSAENGHFETTLQIPQPEVDTHAQDSRLSFAALTKDDESRTFTGEVLLVAPEGKSVISDIDDTVKVSDVTDRRSLLEHTFLLDFYAAPGMPELYREWAKNDVSFHFVSSSPWQLYEPLVDFLDSEGFPSATLDLKAMRFRDETLLDLFKKGTETKPQIIAGILDRYPARQFILVGDSGEQDPEVYAGIFREYPEQIAKIFIRNVSGESADNERFRSVFEGIAEERWQLDVRVKNHEPATDEETEHVEAPH